MDRFEQLKYFEEETHIVEIPVAADSHGHRSANMPLSFQVYTCQQALAAMSNVKNNVITYPSTNIYMTLEYNHHRGCGLINVVSDWSSFFLKKTKVFLIDPHMHFACVYAGDQMVFLLLNLTELIGLILTFKPFLAAPQQYKWSKLAMHREDWKHSGAHMQFSLHESVASVQVDAHCTWRT